MAKRNFSSLKDRDAGWIIPKEKLTLAELCDRYFRTVRHWGVKTVERDKLIARRIKEEWPTGLRSRSEAR